MTASGGASAGASTNTNYMNIRTKKEFYYRENKMAVYKDVISMINFTSYLVALKS